MPLFNQSGYGSGGYGIADGGPIYTLPLGYYLNLLTSEYRLAPNLNAWLLTLLEPLDDITNSLASMAQAFDLDSAVGVQLDTLGLIIGQSRTLNFQPSAGVSPILDDETYRLLLRASISQNQWDGTVGSLQPIWQSLFPGGTIRVIDNQNMSATVVMSGALTTLTQDLISHGLIVPRPMGVQYTYIYGNLPLFGFSTTNNDLIAGFNLGHWG